MIHMDISNSHWIRDCVNEMTSTCRCHLHLDVCTIYSNFMNHEIMLAQIDLQLTPNSRGYGYCVSVCCFLLPVLQSSMRTVCMCSPWTLLVFWKSWGSLKTNPILSCLSQGPPVRKNLSLPSLWAHFGIQCVCIRDTTFTNGNNDILNIANTSELAPDTAEKRTGVQ